MIYMYSVERRKRICERVKQVRIDNYGESKGAQIEMARALRIPYTTYRGYESNRVNDEILRKIAKMFNVDLLPLMGEDEFGKQPGPTITIDMEKGPVEAGKFKIFRMADDSMDPVIPKGAWFGVEPLLTQDKRDMENVIVAYRQKAGTTARKLVVKKDMVIGIPANPDQSGRTVTMQKKEIVGRVVWIFRKL